jgi:hypothetical protein
MQINQRDLAFVAVGAAVASVVIMLWPFGTTTYEQCMLDKMQGQESIDSTVIETAKEACKRLPRKGD